MDEIAVVWGLDELCRLPADQAGKVVDLAAAMGRPCRRSGGVLVVNSPFAGRQVALIVDNGDEGSVFALGGALHELLSDAAARVNLARSTTGQPAAPLPGGHVLLRLAGVGGPAPLVLVPGPFLGSTRLASLLKEELYSAARRTSDTEVLLLEAPRGSLPSGLPAVLIECPPAPPATARHWAAGLKQGLARHFSGEGTSLSGSGLAGEEAVRVFWQRLQATLPDARLTAAAKAVFGLDEAVAPADIPAEAQAEVPAPPVRTLLNRAGSHQSAMKAVRAAMAKFQSMAPGPVPWRAPETTPVPGFRYPQSPYPVSMAPFQRPVGAPPSQETQPFRRFQGPAGEKAETPSGEPCPPGVSPLR